MRLNLHIPEVVRSFKLSVTLIHYALEPPELLPIILQLVNIDCDFFQTWSSNVHVTTIQLKQEGMYYTNVIDLMGIGTHIETH